MIGPNGAGKSTALRALYGLLKPVAGDVLIEGKRVTGMPPWEFIGHRVAMVPQSRSLFGELSVHDNLLLACWTFRKDKARVARALDHAYDRFPILKDRRTQMAGAMSGGQQRFLELGRALVLEPRVLLLDEPTAMVAPKLSAEKSTSSSPASPRKASRCCWWTRTCASACAFPITCMFSNSAATRSMGRQGALARTRPCAT